MIDSAEIRTRQGAVRGTPHDDHLTWRGIPYGQPPVGPLRWRAPGPPPSWSGVRDATGTGPAALQPVTPGAAPPRMSEDCLYLNVCAPARPAPAGGWPVLVWIHGGGYRTGNGAERGDGAAFARAGIVVVTINYRLGALGYLALDGEPDAGAAGLLDQLAALRWVRDTIADFGGDPGRVTVYGVSAGAKSVANLLASPAASGLFQQAISSSGGGDHVATPQTGAELADRLLAELGRPGDVRSVPGAEIIAAQERILSGMTASWLWRPTMHPEALPALPIDLVTEGSAAGVPLLLGHNGNEGALYSMLLGDEAAAAPGKDVLGGILGEQGRLRLLETYRRSRGLPDDTAATIAAMGDERYGVPTQRLADAQAAYAPVYRYRIDVAAPGLPPQFDGGHGTETAMPWQNRQPIPGIPALAPRDPERVRLAGQVHESWVSFVRNGVPAASGLPDWPGYDPRRRPVLVFGPEAGVEFDPRREERLAWGDTRWTSGTWFPA